MMQSRLCYLILFPPLLDLHMFSPLLVCQAVNNLTSVSIHNTLPSHSPLLPQQGKGALAKEIVLRSLKFFNFKINNKK